MSNPIPIESPTVSVRREHQSAPAKHYADVALERAAEDIATGKFVPPKRELEDAFQIALRAGLDFKDYDPHSVGDSDFESTQFSFDLASHPLVAEALDRMGKEMEDAKSSQEYVEKNQMLWELNENSQRKHRWPGQERWKGKENEERRIGQILSPVQFFLQLGTVIGSDRVMIGRYAMLPKRPEGEPESKSGRVPLLVKNDSRKDSALQPANHRVMILAEKLRRLERHFTSARDLSKKQEMQAQINAVTVLLDQEEQRQSRQMYPDFDMVACLQWPLGTEWMILNFDEWGVPTTAKYLGWRTALLSMIRLRVISEDEAHKAFPLKGDLDVANWYQRQLYEWRNGRIQDSKIKPRFQ